MTPLELVTAPMMAKELRPSSPASPKTDRTSRPRPKPRKNFRQVSTTPT